MFLSKICDNRVISVGRLGFDQVCYKSCLYYSYHLVVFEGENFHTFLENISYSRKRWALVYIIDNALSIYYSIPMHRSLRFCIRSQLLHIATVIHEKKFTKTANREIFALLKKLAILFFLCPRSCLLLAHLSAIIARGDFLSAAADDQKPAVLCQKG